MISSGYPNRTTAMPAARSPAQIEASRRNGARSRGPVTEEGKARASRNALKHGLTAMHHLVLEDEAPAELEEMTARLMAEVAPMSEIEARLARRLAIAFWKGERAERIEVALFDAAPKLRPPQAGYQWEQADPLTTFDLKRFNAVRGYQAQQGREISRCLKELRQLRKEALAECTDEPEETLENEPGSPQPPANDDAPEQAERAVLAASGTLAKRTRAAPRRLGGLRPDRCHQGRAEPAARGRRLGGPRPPRRHRRLGALGHEPRRPGLATGAGPVPVPAPCGGCDCGMRRSGPAPASPQ